MNRTLRRTICGSALAACLAVACGTQAQSIANGSFEDPPVTSASVGWTTAPDWLFVEVNGWAGVTANGGPFMGGSPSTSAGARTLFMQGEAYAKQSILATTAAQCTATFIAEQRNSNQDPTGIRLQLELDGSTVWSGIPVKTGFTTYTTSTFSVGAGWHYLAFHSLNPAGNDNTVFIDAATMSCTPTVARTVVNGDFETPNMFGSYQYRPTGGTWNFGPGSGLTGNANAFTGGNPNAPNGGQVAFIQNFGTMSQTPFVSAGTYTLSFKAAQRGNGNNGTQLIRVIVDGVLVGNYQPPSTSYITYKTSPFVLASSSTHTITLEGDGNGGTDFTAFIDDVQLESVSTFWGLTDQGFVSPKWRTNYSSAIFGTSTDQVVYGSCLFPAELSCPIAPPTVFGANPFSLNLSTFADTRFWVLINNNESPYLTCNSGPPDTSQPHANPPSRFGAIPVMDTSVNERFYRAHLVMNLTSAPASCTKNEIPYMSIGAHTNRGNASDSGTAYNVAALNPAAGVPHSVGFTANLFQYMAPTRADSPAAGTWFRFVTVATWNNAFGQAVPRMIQVNLFHDTHNDSWNGESDPDTDPPNGTHKGPATIKWNWPIIANSFYPGAEVVYFDAEDLEPLCGFRVRQLTPTDVGQDFRYDIDLQALYKCASKTWPDQHLNKKLTIGGFSNPMPSNANIPVTVVDWAVEGFADTGYIAPAVSNMVAH